MKTRDNVTGRFVSAKVSDLPQCPVRTGRLYDQKPVICCGHRQVEPDECMICKAPTKFL
jgi:hypothetical protein